MKKNELYTLTLLGSHVSSKVKQLSYQLSKLEKGYQEIENLSELELESLAGEYHAYFYDIFALRETWKQFNERYDGVFKNED